MRKMSVLLWFLFFGVHGFSQQWSATAYGFLRGTLLKGKWHYSPVQKVNRLIDFTGERITIKDSSGTVKYRLLKDVVTKRVDEDSCIASLRTGYDKDNIRCMVNIVEFNNGVNVLNIMYANISYSYYFRHVED
ncbi:MAG: hypothetical protein JWQ09_3611 [Segetibacter sp.]|nr:hypothetical protein [Segetibacter sp.]